MNPKVRNVGCALSMLTCGGCITFILLFLRGCQQEHSRTPGHGNLTFDVSRDGTRIVFAGEGTGGRDLYLLDRATGLIEAVTNSPDYEILPAFSPDAKRIAFTRATAGVRADQLCVMELTTRQIKQLTDADENITAPTFSSDGQSLLFSLSTEYGWGGLAANWNEAGQLTRLNLRTMERASLVAESRLTTSPTVSRDGHWLAWSELKGAFVAPYAKIGSQRLIAAKSDSPSFSPDGSRIAVVTGTYIPDFHVEIFPTKGGKSSKVPNTAGAMQVRFLPKGRLLVLREFWRSGGTGLPTRALWEVGADGSNPKEVISEARFASPLGSR